MTKCIVTYAADAHEELLDISLPTFKQFAQRHGYDVIVGKKLTDLSPAWNKVPMLLDVLNSYKDVVWLDCDLVIVDLSEDFPPWKAGSLHSMVRHFEGYSEVPNSGVWRLRNFVGTLYAAQLLTKMLDLEVFKEHGWWEQAALLTLMGYAVPPQGSDFKENKCRCVQPTMWWRACQFMRLCWNSHPNYRAEHPRIVHCSYKSMPQRLEVMRALVKDPYFDYPKYDTEKENKDE